MSTLQSSSSSSLGPIGDSSVTKDPMEDVVHTTPDALTVKKPESAMKSFFAGGVGGICAVLVGHPLDLIKVRMQTAGSGSSTNVLGMLTSTFAREGLPGVYRGVTAPLLAVTPMFAVSFWGYDMGQRVVQTWANYGSAPGEGPVQSMADLTLTQKCVAGGLSAIPTTAIMTPTERIKCLMQTSAPGQYRNMLDCTVQVYRTGGMASIYKGTTLTLIRDIPGSIAYFGMYEWVKLGLMKAQGIEDTSKLAPLAVLTAGGLAGMACWAVSIPPDVIKSRFQSAPEGTYRNMLEVYQHLVKEEGYGALFKGLRPAMIRAFPANAACFLGMEMARKLFSFMD